MSRRPFHLLLAAAVVVFHVPAATSAADLSAEMRQLETLTAITSVGIGSGGSPGPFCVVAKGFLAKGTADDFERLTQDKVPLARAMGIYCLARTKAPRAVPVLQSLVDDPWPVDQTIGCIGGRTAIGRFASAMLRNRNFLDGPSADPLLPPAQVFARDAIKLASDVPADDEIVNDYTAVGMVLELLDRKLVTLDKAGFDEVLKHLRPGEPRFLLIKGIGRAKGDADICRFLVGVVRDAEQDATSKLAAASALTRQSDPSAIEALQAEKEFLNAASPGLADRLLDAARLRAKLVQFDRFPQFNAPKPTELNASDHPMILEYVGGHGGSIFDRAQGAGGGGGGLFAGEWVNDGDGDNRPIDNDNLARLAARCREFGKAWDTHSDAAFQIKRFASPDSGSGQVSGKAMRAIYRDLNRAIRERE